MVTSGSINLRSALVPDKWYKLYKRGRRLGAGNFGTVYYGVKCDSQESCAIKIVSGNQYISPHQQMQCLLELYALKSATAVGNRNILRLISGHEDINESTGLPRLTIVTGLATGGELFDRIVSMGHYSESMASKVTAKLARALSACHKVGIVHRDLKPENILLESDAEDAEPIIADFGLALVDGVPDVRGPNVVGTYMYCAPEIILHRQYGPPSDVWALGVLLYIMLAGTQPFYADPNYWGPNADAELFRQICSGEFDLDSDAMADVSDCAKDLIRRMLHADPISRITLDELLQHPWITNFTPVSNKPLTKTISALKRFNARRKIRAAVMAVRFGAGRLTIHRRLANMLETEGVTQAFTPDELSSLSSAFRKASGGSPTVEFEGFQKTLKSVGLDHLPAKRLFTLMDIDGSGDIDYREFLAGLASLKNASSVGDEIKEADAGDTGEGGTSSGATGQKALKLSPPDAASLKLCFQLFDLDGNDSLSRDEVIHMLLVTGFGASFHKDGVQVSQPDDNTSNVKYPFLPDEESPEQREMIAALESIFYKLDINGDGYVTLAEFEAALVNDEHLRKAVLQPLKRFDSKRTLLG